MKYKKALPAGSLIFACAIPYVGKMNTFLLELFSEFYSMIIKVN